MVIRPGGTAVVFFNVHRDGVDVGAGYSTTARVYRGTVLTSIIPRITLVPVGGFAIEFDVPSNWTGYDEAFVRFGVRDNATGDTHTCTKHAGVVGAAGLDDLQELAIDRVLDLLEADETYDKATGKARKLLRGTSTVLIEKDVVGSTCVDSVEITE